ncbi:MFS transporter [Actinomadura barringtoniae]|uniref:MFS transporter n=1 Tax=Actinomadura barringtoniae TaxID=1427535 RepID=A0A939T9P2_9ACTN|nr:MFS transporter [Actinomadura barringtoniae]MBO2455363.1 MFS transporter [Actinomadura barringtoniae]
MRNVRLLMTGLAVTMAGDSLMLLVFAIWIKTLTGSTGAAGLVLLCVSLPFALSPAFGWLVDRVRHRRFLVTVNCASAVMLLPLLAVRGRDDMWIVYVVAVLYGTSMVASSAALNGLLKELFTEERLASANGRVTTVQESLRLGGPLAGAALFGAFGGGTVAVVDAATFLVAGGAIALVRVSERTPERVEAHWRQEVSAGVRHLFAELTLRRTVLVAAVAWLSIGLVESVSFALADQGLHRPPEFVGVLASAQGVGAVIGGLAAARALARVGDVAGTGIGLAGFGVGNLVCVYAWLPSVLGGRVVSGFGLALFLIGFTTILQRKTPRPLIGRASTAAETLTSGPHCVAMGVGAALISLVDYRVLLVMTGIGTLGSGVVLAAGRGAPAGEPDAT